MALNCLACKVGTLRIFDETPTMITFTCTHCDKTMTAKTQEGKIQEIVVPGITKSSGVAAVLKVLGIADMDALVEMVAKKLPRNTTTRSDAQSDTQ